eukprot:12550938-Prorocentrum_lima.AAC.1
MSGASLKSGRLRATTDTCDRSVQLDNNLSQSTTPFPVAYDGSPWTMEQARTIASAQTDPPRV